MLFSLCLLATSCILVSAQDPFQKHTIKAKGIEVSLIGYGARITNLLVKDKHGDTQDVVLGYDNTKDYLTDTSYFGPVVGRYANRIKNGTFTIDGETSHIVKNEHGGLNPLHGGLVGYDKRNWTITAQNKSSITFTFLDPGYEGFPGTVLNHATYAVCENRLTISLVSLALDKPTPVMLASHVYWNLNAFAHGSDGSKITNHVLHMPYSKRMEVIDGILIPTGELKAVAGTPFDFTMPKTVGKDLQSAKSCGYNCTGYDNAFIIDRPRSAGKEDSNLVVLSLSSPITGIKLDIRTNQQSLQFYSCVGQTGTTPLKKSQQHGHKTAYVEKYGCAVIETQQWIDGINHPEWGQDSFQIYSPETGPAVNYATFDFSVTK
ncbi:hypothetical protein H072_338 [Dactylellina haptotyla CBS 200.50]|uniref:Aldose 1-epimerase n=1 Tax=Dactylellina haptotyla (strain CBS 200.50) TaxID=1284197 RepID=S8ARR2_DACHA|nr:hypothetical protein H072_338 [Dactylellina haptotyla CBS 200.50]